MHRKERAARDYALVVDRLYRLYRDVVDKTLLNAGCVGPTRISTDDPGAGQIISQMTLITHPCVT